MFRRFNRSAVRHAHPCTPPTPAKHAGFFADDGSRPAVSIMILGIAAVLIIFGAPISQRRSGGLRSDEPFPFAHIQPTPEVNNATAPASPMHLCVVTSGLYPLVRVGGISRAFRTLVESLSTHVDLADHYERITLFYPGLIGTASQAKVDHYWQAFPKVRVRFVDVSSRRRDYGTHRMVNAARVRDAVDAVHTRDMPCSLILSHDMEAPSYYLVVDRSAAHSRSVWRVPIITWVHAQHDYTDEVNGRSPASAQAAIVNTMERYVVRNSDVVISPSRWYLDWLEHEQGVEVSRTRAAVIFNLLGGRSRDTVPFPRGASHFLFYTRVEPLKGIFDFIFVADRVCATSADATFHVAGVDGGGAAVSSSVELKIAAVNVKAGRRCIVRHRSVTDSAAAAVLAKKLSAVVLSVTLADSSSYVLMELFSAGVPFISYRTGGIPELFDCELCFSGEPGDVHAMVQRVQTLVDDVGQPGTTIARRFSERASLRAFHNIFVAAAEGTWRTDKRPALDTPPLITVALTSRNRPLMLRESLDSVANASARCTGACSIVVLDSSSSPDDIRVRRVVSDVSARHPAIDIRLVRLSPSTKLEEVRNRAFHVEMFPGRQGLEYVCFFDDDDLALPTMLADYSRTLTAARGPSVISGFARVEVRSHLGEVKQSYSSLSLNGPSATETLLHMDTKANFCVKKKDAVEIGGHTPLALVGARQRNAPYVDWAFIVKCFGAGLSFALVPEETYVYIKRDPPPTALRATSIINSEVASYKSLFHDATEMDIFFAKRRIVQEVETFVDPKFRTSVALALMNALPKSHSVRTS